MGEMGLGRKKIKNTKKVTNSLHYPAKAAEEGNPRALPIGISS